MPALPEAAPTAPSAPARRASGWPALLAIVVAWALMFAPQLFSARVFVAGDWPAETPFSEFSLAHWHAAHERALWNPYVMLGVPASASLADSRPQWLPAPVLGALAALPQRPVWPGLALPLLAHLAGMLAMAALARALWGVRPWAACTAALAWGLLPELLVPFAWGHHAQMVTEGLMPVALLGVHATFAPASNRSAMLAALGLALVFALQIAAGHPQFTYYAIAIAAVFALERARSFSRPARLAAFAQALLLAFALAAAVLLPMLEYGADSIRAVAGGTMLAEVQRYSLALRDVAVFAWAGAMGFGDPTYWGGMAGTDFPFYAGLLVLLLAAAGVAARGRRGEAVGLFAATVIAGTLLAGGTRLGPLFELLRRALPLFSRLRVAVATVVLAQLAIALLAARGAERLLAGSGSRTTRALLVAGAVLAALMLAVLALAAPFQAAWTHAALAARPALAGPALAAAAARAWLDLVMHLAIAVTGLAAIALVRRRRTGLASRRALLPLAGPALALLVALDLGGVSLPYLRRATGPREALAGPPRSALARAVAARPGTRGCELALDNLVRGNDAITWRVPALGGAHGTPILLWAQLIGTGVYRASAVERALAVSVVAAPAGVALPESAYAALPGADGGSALWALRRPLTRAYAVSRVEAATNDMAVLGAMASPGWDPASQAFTTDAAAAGEFPGGATCAIRWLDDAPDHQRLETTANAPAFLVIADAWDRGWQATLDGARVPLARVDHVLRGIAVPGGTHRVALSYRPPGWDRGRLVAGIAAALWLALLAAALFKMEGAPSGRVSERVSGRDSGRGRSRRR